MRPDGKIFSNFYVAVLLVVVATYPRVVFTGFGLPFVLNGDEAINLGVLGGMVERGSLNPEFFRYPSLLFNINLPVYVTLDRLIGPLAPLDSQAIGTAYLENPQSLLAARLVNVLAGVATVLVVFCAVLSATGSRVCAIMGGLFLALNPLSMRHAAFFTPDVLCGFFVASCLWASIVGCKHPHRRCIVLAGAMAGLAASTKYNGGLVLIAPATAILLANLSWPTRLTHLVASGLAAGLALVLASPYLVLDFDTAVADVLFEMRHYSQGHPGAQGDSMVRNAVWTFAQLGWLLLVLPLSLLGVQRRYAIPVIVFAGAYFLLLSAQFVRFERNLIPLFPALFILSGLGLWVVLSWFKRFLPRHHNTAALAVCVCSALLYGGGLSKAVTQFSDYERDPRRESRAWLEQVMPKDARVTIEAYTPYLRDFARDISSVPFLLREDPKDLELDDFVVVTRDGSGRFLRAGSSPHVERFAQYKAKACATYVYPEGWAIPALTVFRFRCDAPQPQK